MNDASHEKGVPRCWHSDAILSCTSSTRTPKRSIMADEKAAALSNALAQIERQFGKGSIMKMGEIQERMAFDVISSGSIALDLALGVGGFPRGRIIEIYGPESSGKTTLALHVIAEAQKNGGTAAFIDVEHALDPAYAQNLGIDLDNLLDRKS